MFSKSISFSQFVSELMSERAHVCDFPAAAACGGISALSTRPANCYFNRARFSYIGQSQDAWLSTLPRTRKPLWKF